MKWLKLFEEFQKSKFTIDNIIDCIESDGKIFATIIKDYPNNDPKIPVKPVSIDEDGNITIDIDGQNYEVDLKDVDKISYEE